MGFGISRKAGVTLIELILVMMVLFTLATVVAPRFTDFFPSLQVRKTADHLLAWMKKARADAATTGARQRLVLDPQQKKFWIEYEAKPLKEPGKFTVLQGAWSEETLPEAVVFESMEGAEEDPAHASRRYLEFRADGTSTDATLVVTNEQGDRRTIQLVGTSSRVYIEPPPEE